MIIHNSKIHERKLEISYGRGCLPGGKDILPVLEEYVPGECEPIVEHPEVNTIILLVCLLPGHILIALTCFHGIRQHPDCRIDPKLPTTPRAIGDSRMIAGPASKEEETVSGILVISHNSV